MQSRPEGGNSCSVASRLLLAQQLKCLSYVDDAAQLVLDAERQRDQGVSREWPRTEILVNKQIDVIKDLQFGEASSLLPLDPLMTRADTFNLVPK